MTRMIRSLAILALACGSLLAQFTPIRIAAGRSSAYTDPRGQVWAADSGFDSGSAFYNSGAYVEGTFDMELYRSGRLKAGSLGYSFAVPNGTYRVKLKFS